MLLLKNTREIKLNVGMKGTRKSWHRVFHLQNSYLPVTELTATSIYQSLTTLFINQKPEKERLHMLLSTAFIIQQISR